MSKAKELVEKYKVNEKLDTTGRGITNIPVNKRVMQDITTYTMHVRQKYLDLTSSLKSVPDTTDARFNSVKKIILKDLDKIRDLTVSAETAAFKLLRDY